MQTKTFAGKVAIVTGAAGSIGSATTIMFLERGAVVVAVDRLEANWHALKTSTDSSLLMLAEADVTQELDVQGYVTACLQRYSRIDILFNNAGIEGAIAPIESYDFVEFKRVQAVNVDGSFLALKYVLPVMYAQGCGSIINTSSVAGLRGGGGMIGYSASKHAVVGMTKAAACEAAPHGVRVNAINPGPIEGRMISAIGSAMDIGGRSGRETISAGIPAGRYGHPKEVAELVAFLASDAAAYCNGGTYTIDGAYTAM